jgi:hypothetical protein
MADKIHVVTDELHTHAANVGHLAERVDNCAHTGAGTDFGADTFGLVGQIFSVGCRQQAHAAADSLGQAASAVRDVSQGLRDTADTYHGDDNDNAELFERLHRALDDGTNPGVRD